MRTKVPNECLCVLFFSLFWGPSEFWETLMRSSPSRVTGIKTASLWVYTHRNTEPVCVLQCDKQKYNTKNSCVFPLGWKSWRVVHISIKIMQSVVLWLSFCSRVTVSFPSINLALCYFVASLPAEFLNKENPFSQFFEKWPVFLNFSLKMTCNQHIRIRWLYISLETHFDQIPESKTLRLHLFWYSFHICQHAQIEVV